jgi:arginase
VPLVDRRGVVLIGPRDGTEIAAAGLPSLRGAVAFFADDAEVDHDRPSQTMVVALAAIDAGSFWLHIDLDVLSSEAFSAVDHPQPGGLDRDQLDRLAAAAARDPRCGGASVAIYNPDRDDRGRGATQVIDFTRRLVERSSADATTP